MEDYLKDRSWVYGSEYWVDETKAEIRACKERTYRNVLGEIIKHKKSGRLLDFGGGKGLFSEYASEYFKCTTYDKHMGRDRGIMPKGEYEVITLLDVIEHIPRPKHLLSKLAGMLSKGGIIAITTPDAGSFWKTILGERWTHYKYEHVLYLSEKSMRRLARECGLEIVHMGPIYYHFSLAYAEQYSRNYRVLGMKLDTLLEKMPRPLKSIVLPNPLTSELLVVLKKSSSGFKTY